MEGKKSPSIPYFNLAHPSQDHSISFEAHNWATLKMLSYAAVDGAAFYPSSYLWETCSWEKLEMCSLRFSWGPWKTFCIKYKKKNNWKVLPALWNPVISLPNCSASKCILHKQRTCTCLICCPEPLADPLFVATCCSLAGVKKNIKCIALSKYFLPTKATQKCLREKDDYLITWHLYSVFSDCFLRRPALCLWKTQDFKLHLVCNY